MRTNGRVGDISQTPFFNDPGVRRQLNLNDNQFNTLNRAYQNAYNRYNQGFNGLGNNLTEDQREQQMLQLQNQFNTDFNQGVDSTLTDPQMRTRFGQLNRQFMGFNGFNDPGIQRQLNLTPQQRTELRQLAAQWRTQLRQMTSGPGGRNANVNNIDPSQWTELSNQYWTRLNNVLTPEQQQTWSQLTGQRYDFPIEAYSGQSAATGAANGGQSTVSGTGSAGTGGTGTAGNGTPNSGGFPGGNTFNTGTQNIQLRGGGTGAGGNQSANSNSGASGGTTTR
jgi:hypothetical protein